MEELRSTEILDREIETDARKKTEKILKSADEECEKILSQIDERVKKATEEKSAQYENKISRFEKNTKSSVPLEKERFRVTFYFDSVSFALNEYLKNIGAEKRLVLIKKKLAEVKSAVFGKKTNAFVFGMDLRDAENLLRKELGFYVISVKEIAFEKSGEQAETLNDFHEGIILESEDKVVTVRLTMDEIVREIKDKYGYELASALFYGRLPE